MRILEPSVSLLWMTPDALRVIEAAGRVCYQSEDRMREGGAADFVRSLIRRGHEAVIEHALASFRIVTDRGVSHEMVRHRLASYCQESTRYCNYAKEKFGHEIGVIEPPGLTGEAREIWREACEGAEAAYFRLLEKGMSPQIARAVLPTCLKTEFVMTANFREWRHILRLRLAPQAHPQMIEIARKIGEILVKECPPVFEDLWDSVPRP